jgi:lysophospholipase L1-like esterase
MRMTVAFLLVLGGCVVDQRDPVVQAICACDPVPDAGVPDARPPDAGVPDAAAAPDAAPAHTFVRFHLLGDSVPIAGASDAAHRTPALLAATYPGVFFNQAIGGRSLYFYASDAPRRASVVATIAAGKPSEVYIELGYNDYGAAPWSASDYGLAYADFVDRLRAALPDVRVYCQTIHVHGTGKNAKGSTVDDYSAAVRAACAGRAEILEGDSFGLVKPVDYADAVHLKDSGHAKLAAGIRARVGW